MWEKAIWPTSNQLRTAGGYMQGRTRLTMIRRVMVHLAAAALVIVTVGNRMEAKAAGPFPGSCQDIKTGNSSAVDGDYLIYPNVGGGLHRVYSVYCKDMGSAPKEYLTL